MRKLERGKKGDPPSAPLPWTTLAAETLYKLSTVKQFATGSTFSSGLATPKKGTKCRTTFIGAPLFRLFDCYYYLHGKPQSPFSESTHNNSTLFGEKPKKLHISIFFQSFFSALFPLNLWPFPLNGILFCLNRDVKSLGINSRNSIDK